MQTVQIRHGTSTWTEGPFIAIPMQPRPHYAYARVSTWLHRDCTSNVASAFSVSLKAYLAPAAFFCARADTAFDALHRKAQSLALLVCRSTDLMHASSGPSLTPNCDRESTQLAGFPGNLSPPQVGSTHRQSKSRRAHAGNNEQAP